MTASCLPFHLLSEVYSCSTCAKVYPFPCQLSVPTSASVVSSLLDKTSKHLRQQLRVRMRSDHAFPASSNCFLFALPPTADCHLADHSSRRGARLDIPAITTLPCVSNFGPVDLHAVSIASTCRYPQTTAHEAGEDMCLLVDLKDTSPFSCHWRLRELLFTRRIPDCFLVAMYMLV